MSREPGIQRRGKGWRASVRVNGRLKTCTFPIDATVDEMRRWRDAQRASDASDKDVARAVRDYAGNQSWRAAYTELCDVATRFAITPLQLFKQLSRLTEPATQPKTRQKLTYRDAVEIRRRLDNGSTPQAIAEHYGVSVSTIQNIRALRAWAEPQP